MNEEGDIICGLGCNKCIFLKVVLFEDSRHKQKYEHWNSIRNTWRKSSLTYLLRSQPLEL